MPSETPIGILRGPRETQEAIQKLAPEPLAPLWRRFLRHQVVVKIGAGLAVLGIAAVVGWLLSQL